MKYRIVVEGDFLRSDLYDRTTLEETRAFLRALRARQRTFGGRRILLSVRQSTPLFRTNGGTSLLDDFESIAPDDGYRIALVGDSRDLRLSHEYLEGLASRRSINLRSFPDEASARRWLDERRAGRDRRTAEQTADQQQIANIDAESRRRERRRFAVIRGMC
jgi:hypothetical protein